MIINCELLSRWFFQAFKNLIKKIMRLKHGRESTSRFLTRLVFCNSIIVLWPNAFHLTDIICAIFSHRKEKLLKFFSKDDTTLDSERNTLEVIFPFVRHNSCFWHILVASFCFPQISSSYLVVLAQGGLYRGYTWTWRKWQCGKCENQHLYLYINVVLNFWSIHSWIHDPDISWLAALNSGAYSTLLHAAWWRAVFRCGPWRLRFRCPSCLCNSMRKRLMMCTLVPELTLRVCTCCSRSTTMTSSTQYKSPIARLTLSLGDCLWMLSSRW